MVPANLNSGAHQALLQLRQKALNVFWEHGYLAFPRALLDFASSLPELDAAFAFAHMYLKHLVTPEEWSGYQEDYRVLRIALSMLTVYGMPAERA